MKWHDRPLICRIYADRSGIPPSDVLLKRVNLFCYNILKKHNGDQRTMNECAHFQNEAIWFEQDKRPYYNVWPSVVEPFTKIDLSRVRCDEVKLPLDRLMIRFAAGHELCGRVQTIFVANGKSATGSGAWIVSAYCGEVFESSKIPIVYSKAIVRTAEMVGNVLHDIYTNRQPDKDNYLPPEIDVAIQQIVVALSLLGDNPDLIEQLPLEADREKWERTHDLKLIDKAARRGKRGWDVGRHVEAAPGFRHPHFAIRWMGHGLPKRPVLRPIKGCLVRKKQILEVPTDWMDQPRKEHTE